MLPEISRSSPRHTSYRHRDLSKQHSPFRIGPRSQSFRLHIQVFVRRISLYPTNEGGRIQSGSFFVDHEEKGMGGIKNIQSLKKESKLKTKKKTYNWPLGTEFDWYQTMISIKTLMKLINLTRLLSYFSSNFKSPYEGSTVQDITRKYTNGVDYEVDENFLPSRSGKVPNLTVLFSSSLTGSSFSRTSRTLDLEIWFMSGTVYNPRSICSRVTCYLLVRTSFY